MKKYLTLIASFIIMLSLGGVYAWSIFASELIEKYDFSAAQTQFIFGALIAVFPTTMIFADRLAKKIKVRNIGYLSGLLFLSGYLFAGLSGRNFIMMVSGISVLTGMGTGFGYWVSISIPVQWFPERKGLITGISAAGFGLGAFVLSMVSEIILSKEADVFQLFRFIGLAYGFLIIVISRFIYLPVSEVNFEKNKQYDFLASSQFLVLLLGIFLGTFSGLLIIGNLKLIGEHHDIPNHVLILGVSFFAMANFLGRLMWGLLSDYLNESLSVFLALTFQSISIFLLGLIFLSHTSYLLLSILIGFGFGGNFVLFAKETAHIFGVNNLGRIYPYVFLGYAIAGITGPLSGGLLFDYFHGYKYSVLLAGSVSFCGGLLFLFYTLRTRLYRERTK